MTDNRVTEDTPGGKQWQRLYQLTEQLREAAPWEWMADGDIFGVHSPVSDQVNYCTFLGKAGKIFGFAVYRGDRGLVNYMLAQRGHTRQTLEFQLTLDHLLLLFAPERMLSERDRATLVEHGSGGESELGIPQFRSQLPLQSDRWLNSQEAEDLALTLEEALAVAGRVRNEELSLRGESAEYLLVMQQEKETGQWKETRRRGAVDAGPYLAPETVLTDQAKKALNLFPEGTGSWQVDTFVTPAQINEDPLRPYSPLTMIAIDREDGALVGADMVGPDEEIGQRILERFAGFCIEQEACPASIEVTSPLLASSLKPLITEKGITVDKLSDQGDKLKEARNALIRRLIGEDFA